MAITLDIAFLFIHVALFFMFRNCGVKPMMYYNIFCIVFYTIMPYCIHKDLFRFYCIGVYLEVTLHMALAVFYTGWDAGFQVTLIGMSILSAYCEYAGRYLKIPYLHAVPLNLVGMFTYTVMCIVNNHHTAPYPLPDSLNYILRLGWGFITFTITIYFLYTFVKLTTETEEILAREADHDQLTGLPNRFYIWDYFNRLDREGKLSDQVAAMLDIDDFKIINDTYGHNCGDHILKELAAILRYECHGMKVCRWGGEEFLLVGETHGDVRERYREMEKLLESVAGYRFRYEGHELKITVTIGMASFVNGESIRDWIDHADRKLYEGKHQGKNCLVA